MLNNKSLILASFVMAANAAMAGDVDYSKGVFIVNEDWFGHNNSTLNYLNPDDESGDYWHYRVIQAENPGVELGCTAQFGTIFDGRMYIISKQEMDGGASIEGGRITIADAASLRVLHQSATIDPSDAQSDGRAFLGINSSKGYVSTSNGVWILDLDTYEIKGRVTDPNNLTANNYCTETGIMLAVDNKVFAANQKAGVLVIDSASDEIVNVISMDFVSEGAGIGSIVQSLDGMLWLSVAADKAGSGTALPYIVKLDPATLETSIVNIADGLYAPSNSWYAWTPDAFCASSCTNTLYWKGASNRWFDGGTIYKYDIDNDEQSVFIDLDGEGAGWKVYGCSMRMHPQTDEMYMSLYKSVSSKTYVTRRYNNQGTLLNEYAMQSNYWFPSVPFFPVSSAQDAVTYVVSNNSDIADIYNLSGVLVARSVSLAQLPALVPGIYIARTANATRKLLIK
jgi:hypothetical protein